MAEHVLAKDETGVRFSLPAYNFLSASLAQLVEQLPLKEMVGGSNPSRGNKRSELTSEGFERND